MAIEKVFTGAAPAPIGPYSQAVVVNGTFIYTAGQIPLDPESGNLVDGDIQAQTRKVLQNLENILLEARSSLKSVIKTTVFLKDMGEFAAMNEVDAEFLGESAPARSAVEVARLPRDVRVEIEAIALVEG